MSQTRNPGRVLQSFRAGTAACLVCSVAVCGLYGAQVGQPALVEAGPTFVQLAEAQRINLCLLPTGVDRPVVPAPATPVGTVEDAARLFQAQVTLREGVTWVARPYRGSLVPGGRCLTKEEQAIQRAVHAGAGRLGEALLASLTPEQRYNLQFRPRPEEALTAYEHYEEARQRALKAVAEQGTYGELEPYKDLIAQPYLNIGGHVAGQEMNDFQRRLCAAVFYAAVPHDSSRVFTAESCALGDFFSEMKNTVKFAPEVIVTNWFLNSSLTIRRPGTGFSQISLLTDGCLRKGEQVEDMAAWARAVAVREVRSERVSRPPSHHRTDGPTRDVTSLISEEEARILVPTPHDMGMVPAQRLFDAFKQAGIEIVWPRTENMWFEPGRPTEPGETEGISLMSVLTLGLTGRGASQWVREGNRLRLVFDWELTGQYALDPSAFLPAEVLGRKVTLTLPKAPLSDFLKALREQTAAPLELHESVAQIALPISCRLVDVPLRSVLTPLPEYLGAAWEKAFDGTVLLSPRARLREMENSFLLVGEEATHHADAAAGMALWLLLETLSPEQTDLAASGILRAADLAEVPRALLLGCASVALRSDKLEPGAVAVKVLRADEQGRTQATVFGAGQQATVEAVAPPTIPPNPLRGPMWCGMRGLPTPGPSRGEPGAPPLPR